MGAGGDTGEWGDLEGYFVQVYKYMHIYLWTALRIMVCESGQVL